MNNDPFPAAWLSQLGAPSYWPRSLMEGSLRPLRFQRSPLRHRTHGDRSRLLGRILSRYRTRVREFSARCSSRAMD
jgi:hypothetical protein